MITRYRVSIGGIQLDSLDDNIVILDVSYSPVSRKDTTFIIADMDGYDTSDEYYESQTVTVNFQLRIYDPQERNAVCQKINRWAMSNGDLKTSDRNGQHLVNVRCQQFASVGSVRGWLDEMSLIFVTEHVPFWISDTKKTVTITGKNNRGTLKMDGNVGNALVSVSATANEAVNSIQFTVGSSVLKLTGLSVAKNQKIVIDYVKNRYLRIRANGVSVMNKLSQTSSDLLLAPCGIDVQIGVVSSGKVTATFEGRGEWL